MFTRFSAIIGQHKIWTENLVYARISAILQESAGILKEFAGILQVSYKNLQESCKYTVGFVSILQESYRFIVLRLQEVCEIPKIKYLQTFEITNTFVMFTINIKMMLLHIHVYVWDFRLHIHIIVFETHIHYICNF